MNVEGKFAEMDLYLIKFRELRAHQMQIIDKMNKLDEQTNHFHDLLRIRRIELQELQEKISQHEQLLVDLKIVDENLDVEIIRARSQLKKSKKYIDKMQTMNASKIKVEVDDADKGKVLKVQLRLKILKSLLECHVNNEMKGFSLSNGDDSLRPFNITNTLSHEMIRNIFWENCKSATTQNSDNKEQWNSLFS